MARRADAIDLPLYRPPFAIAEQELVYPCTCTRTDVERRPALRISITKGRSIPGPVPADVRGCDGLGERPLLLAVPRADGSPGLRGWLPRADADGRVSGRRFRGLESCTDRVASTPAYQLAVVVDDAAKGVTEVVRGDDLVPSTPRQLLLYEALGLHAAARSSTSRWWSASTADGWPSGTATRGCRRCARRG